MWGLRLFPFRDDEVYRLGSGRLDIRPRGVEMRIVRDDLALPADRGKQDALCRATLVGGNDVGEAGERFDLRFEAVKTIGPRVGIVSTHHGGPLL